MSYRDFTLKEVTRRFGLSIAGSESLFAGAPEVKPSPLLRELLQEYLPLARAINTEKARSEFLIAPILAEVRARLGHRISLFSGVEFTVVPEQGLNGFCDFILSRSPEQQFLTAPLVAIVEAKNENLKAGLGQCIAAMVGARVFNEREGIPIRSIYGAVTSGTLWQFLRLEGPEIRLDEREYHLVERLATILGIFVQMFAEEGVQGGDVRDPVTVRSADDRGEDH
jgi:hypothetical protein